MGSVEVNNHEKFLSHLDFSAEALFIIALFLHRKGFDVWINGLKKASRHKDWKEFKDDGDLYVVHKGSMYRIEVKGLSCSFTGLHNWPYRDFIVCAKHSFDNAIQKPYAYMILNKERTHIGIVKSSTRSSWEVVERQDNRYENITQTFYTCPLSVIEWKSIFD
jgi:hypothetical protein